MATAYSGEVSVGTYNRIRIKCDYSGTSATCTVQFRRTQAYSGYWGDSRATLTFNGATKNAGYSYSGTVGTSWINLVTVSGYSVSTSGGTYNWNFSNPGGGALGCSGSIYIGSQGSAPSQLGISLVNATWNSVAFETTVGNWGTGTNWQREAYLLEVPYVAGVDKYHADSYDNTTQPVLMNVGTHSAFEFSNNPFVVYGCKEYYTGLFASTTAGEARLQGPTFYTAPYKLDSLTYTSETFDGSTITATIAAKTNSTWNKSGATVGFLYQVSTDGGETFDGWKDLSTAATVGTTANLSIPNLQPGTAYVVEVAQICMDADIKYSSESSFVNFTTKKYRKTYGPGASGYVTSTFTDDAKHTVENTADHTLLGYSLLGKTEQEKVTSSDSKNLVPLTPITGLTVFSTNNATYEYIWDKELKQTVLHMTSNGSYPQICFSTTNYGLTANKNYAVSIRYKATTNKTSFDGLGCVGFCGRNTWEVMGSNGSGVKPSPNRSEIQPANEWTVTTLRISSSAPEWTSYTWNMTNRMSIMMAYSGANKTDFWISDISVEEITDAQYSADTFTPTFKPYTNKLSAPSPDYPLPVQTVTGRQTISITGDNGEEQEYEINLGKNIFKPYATSGSFVYNGVTTTMNSDGTVTLNGTATGDGWPELIYTFGSNTSTRSTPYLPANGMYTATIRLVSGTYSKGTSSYDAAWMVVCKSDLSGTGGIPVSGGSVVVAGVNGIYRSWINYRTGNTFNNARFALQFEKGSEATAWAPYFTPIELNKLDTYQDKIYRNSGKWYVHKEMGRHTFNGSETWNQAAASDSGRRFSSQVTGIKSGPQGTFNTVGYSTHFPRSNGDTYGNYGISGSTGANVYVRDTKFDSMDGTGVKSWFASNPTDIWYVLATATDTEITYAPLVKQLETLYRLGHTSVDATTFDRNGYGNATVGLEVKTANASSLPVDSTLVTKQFRKLYGAKPAKKNLLDVPLNFTITSSNRYKSVPVTLESGKTYTYSVQGITTDSATEFLMLPINGSTAVGDGVKLTPTTKSMTFTMSGNADRVYIYSSKNWADSGSHTTTYHGIMIEEGNEATTYQAYSDGGKAGKAKKIKKLYGPVPAQVNLIHVGPLTQIDSTQTSNGLLWTKRRLTCEEVNVSGTVSSGWSNFGPQYSVNWPAGTYTMSIDRKLPFSIYFRSTGGGGDKSIPVGQTSVTFTTTSTITAYYLFASNMTSGTVYNETFKIQLVKGSTPDYNFKLYSDGTNANTTKLIYND